jgi:hypothetical protein
VHEEKDCSAEMGKCAEATTVELTQADLCNLKHCSPEELPEMGKCVETTSIAANLFNPKPNSPEESVAQVLDADSSKLPPQENKATGNPVTRAKDIFLPRFMRYRIRK